MTDEGRFAELRGAAGAHDLALLDQVAVVGEGEGHPGVLLHQEDGGALVVDGEDHVEDLLDQQRREAEGRLVQRQARPGGQGPPPPEQGVPPGGPGDGNEKP